MNNELTSLQYDKSLLKSCGDDTFVSANVEIRRPQLVSIGSHTAIDSGFYLTTSAEIGDYVHLAPYITIIGGAKGLVVFKDFSTLAAGSRVICGSDEHKGYGLVGPTIPDEFKDRMKLAPVVFERCANIGTNVVIMPGVTLGEGSVVGACSLVNKSTDPWGVYVGIPAVKVGERKREKILSYVKALGH